MFCFITDGIVNFLLESEADPRIRNRKRQTPYNVAQNADIRKELQNIMNDPPPTVVRYSRVIFYKYCPEICQASFLGNLQKTVPLWLI